MTIISQSVNVPRHNRRFDVIANMNMCATLYIRYTIFDVGRRSIAVSAAVTQTSRSLSKCQTSRCVMKIKLSKWFVKHHSMRVYGGKETYVS